MPKPPPIPLYPHAKQQSQTKPVRKFVLLWLSVIGALLVVTICAVWWVGGNLSASGYATDDTPRKIIVGGKLLSIPANMIRHEEQRKAVTLNKIDLVLSWPKGTGYSEADKKTFEDTGRNQKLIYFSIGKQKLRNPMSQRLPTVYRQLFHGAAEAGPGGLALQPLKRGAGYDGEELAIYADSQQTWVARCQLETSLTAPKCLRDIHIEGRLSVQFRFARSLLKEWQAIEKMMKNKVGEFSRSQD